MTSKYMNGTLPLTWCWSLSPRQVCSSSSALPSASCALHQKWPNQHKQEPYFLVSGFAFCWLAVGFPKALIWSLFGKYKSKALYMCTKEMSPSALQRVCPSRQETQVALSFLRMGIPREACHVPGVRCLEFSFGFSH